MSKPIKALLACNLFFWIYFGIAFKNASYPYKHDPWGHPSGAGYTFFGQPIGIIESPFAHSFYRAAFWVQFPSLLLARVGEQVLFGHALEDRFYGGISEGGWRLLVVALLSFFQWYFVGWAAQELRRGRSISAIDFGVDQFVAIVLTVGETPKPQ